MADKKSEQKVQEQLLMALIEAEMEHGLGSVLLGASKLMADVKPRIKGMHESVFVSFACAMIDEWAESTGYTPEEAVAIAKSLPEFMQAVHDEDGGGW